MSTADGKVVRLDVYAAGKRSETDTVAAADTLVGHLLRRMEDDVANVVASAASKRTALAPSNGAQELSADLAHGDEMQPVEASRFAGADFDSDDAGPLPRLFTAPADGRNVPAPVHEKAERLAEYKGAALRGFLAGLLLIVPVVVWTTFALVPSQGVSTRPASESVGFIAASSAGGAISRRDETALAVLPSPLVKPQSALAKSAELIRNGDVLAARRILSAPELSGVPTITMALAETYDPNMLAAWNARAVVPDITMARLLYSRAAAAGVQDANNRLAALGQR